MTRRALILAACVLVASAARGDDIYWNTGKAWRGVTVSEIAWTTGGMTVRVESAPQPFKPGIYGGAVRIVMSKPVPPVIPLAKQPAVRPKRPQVRIVIVPPRGKIPAGSLGATGRVRENPDKVRNLTKPRNGNPGIYQAKGEIRNTTGRPIRTIELELDVLRGGASMGLIPCTVRDIPVGHSKSFWR